MVQHETCRGIQCCYKSRLETVNETIKWFGTSQDGLEEVYKEKQKYTGHDCSVGILFSLFFSPISMAQRVVHLVALTVLEVFPRGLNSLVVFLAVYMDLRKAPT